MKVEKLNTNSYRIRKMIKGKNISIVFDHKPSQKEIIQALSDAIDKPKSAHNGSLKEYCYKYIEDKSNLLKSSTKQGYIAIVNNLPGWLSVKNINDITELDMEKYVNEMAAGLSPKTIKNRYSFIVSVISKYNKHFSCDVNLPMVVHKDFYIPTEEDITNIVQKLENTKYEIPIKLAVLGLRRSEIGGLSIEDVRDDGIYIHRSLTQGIDSKWIMEETNKTAASTRFVALPPSLYNKILEQGYIYDGSLHTLYDVLDRTCKSLNIPHISIHRLRHFYASYCHEKGLSEAQIMEMGGWSTPNIMKSVYRHAMNKEKAQKEIAKSLGNLF